MNKGVLQNNSPVQQMIASVNPSLWNINNLIKPPFISSPPSSSSSSIITNFLAPPPNSNNNDVIISHHNNHHNHSFNNNLMQAHQHSMNMSTTSSSSWLDEDHQQIHPFHGSWSQLLLGGLSMEEEAKRMESWEEQLLLQQHHNTLVDHVKQESSVNSYINTNNNNINNNNNTNNNVYITHNNINNNEEFQVAANWSSQQISIPASSPQSCVTTAINNTNMLDFSSNCANDNLHPRPNNPVHFQDHSSECTTGGVQKKAKVQPSPSQSTFKVRKEKLGDRITALHQLVSPFGKTDTASVLLEAIGYIRFLQSQVEALSLPYLTNGAGSKKQPHTHGEGERKCIFPEDPGQLLNENGLKRKGGPIQELHEEVKDLRSKGLCLVPISCTMHVGSDNGADYWAPAFGGGFR